MTIPAPYALLLQIASCDARTAQLNQLATSLEKQHNAILAEIAAHQAKQDLLANAPRQLKKSIDEFELEIKSITEKLKPKIRQLELLTSEKQTLALSHEIALLQAQKEKLVDAQMDQWLCYEAMLEQHIKDKPATDDWLEKAQGRLSESSDQIAQTETSRAKTDAEHAAVYALLPADWKQQYTRMKSQMPDPIVCVQNGSCGGCYYPLESLVLNKTKRSELATCTMCHRFLVHEAMTLVAAIIKGH